MEENERYHEAQPRLRAERKAGGRVVCTARWLASCLPGPVPRLDKALLALLFVAALGFGGWYLRTHIHTVGYTYKLSTNHLVPAVLWAEGHGFVNPPVDAVPDLGDFLDERIASFSLRGKDVSFEGEQLTLSWFHVHHRYLMWVLAVWWAVFGVSWASFQWLLALFYAVTALCVYGLFRLGTGRFTSTLGALAYMLAPVTLTILPSLRDFSKAPFILAAALLMLYLVRGKRVPRKIMGVALLLGLVIGFGRGFRQDILVCFVPAVAILGLGVAPAAQRVFKVRAAALAVFGGAFLIAAIPTFFTGNAGGGGSMLAHDIICGFATEREADLGLERASYERVYYFSDAFTHAAGNSFGHRVCGITEPIPYNSRQSAVANTRLVLATGLMFPGDMVARAYASVCRILGLGFVRLPAHEYPLNAVTEFTRTLFEPLAQHLEQGKLFYTAAAFLIISGYSFRLAMAGFLLFLFLTAYPCLQFHVRHYFHLTFVSLWFFAFVLDRAFFGMRQLAGQARHRPLKESGGVWWPEIRPAALRMVAFAATAVLLLLVPLHAGRLWQRHNLQAHIAACRDAEVAEVALQREADNGRVRFALAEPIESERHISGPQTWEVQTEYLMAAFTPSDSARDFTLEYRSQSSFNDFSHALTLHPTPESEDGLVRYFIPLYQACYVDISGLPNPDPGFDGRWGRALLEGLTMAPGTAADFQGLYRVRDLSEFGLLFNIQIPPNMQDFRYYQRVPVYWQAEETGTTHG